MDSKEFLIAIEMMAGLLRCQTLLTQYLIKRGVIEKDDIANAVDYLIDYFNERNPNQSISLPMSRFRADLEQTLPDFLPPPPSSNRPKSSRPDWFRGVIDGGVKDE
jgi:hypothetical protein